MIAKGLSGSDIDLVRIAALKTGFSFTLHFNTGWQYPGPNGTELGTVPDVDRGLADIAFGHIGIAGEHNKPST